MLSQRAFADGAPRRTGASSMTSSWYSVARWVSSTTTAAGTISGRVGSPKCAASSVTSGRNRLPPASTRCRADLGDELVVGAHGSPQAGLDLVQSGPHRTLELGVVELDADAGPDSPR